MRSAAKQLEFERAAALRDEIQEIRLRVLEEDASVAVLKAAERAASGAADATASDAPAPVPPSGPPPARPGRGRGTSMGRSRQRWRSPRSPCCPPGRSPWSIAEGTAADVFPGLKDTHEDLDEGWMARWLDRPTWDRRVTPNVVKRTGTRSRRR